MAARRIATTCPYCGVGCGVLAEVADDGRVTVAGDPDHPANRGRLCSKGSALAETLGLEGRLLHPEVGGERVSWELALNTVAAGLRGVVERHGPGAVAFYVSGQLLTEDYYVANKLMKGFIGSANIDTNSRLCMSSAVAAHTRAFGADLVPGCYEDLELADLVVLVGSNAAWCHPVLFQRLGRRREAGEGPALVVVDPRRTATAESADLHLALRPGTDAVLFNGLLDYLRRADALDWGFLEARTEGFAAALETARATAGGIPAVAAACGLDPDAVARFYQRFARTARTVTAWSQGVNQSSSGTDKGNAIINCHLATGRIGKPGAAPLSLTGQPNAMGGREVGGLASTLAAHMDFAPHNVARVGRFWRAPNMASAPGLKAVDLFEAVHAGRVKAVWIMATNPVVSLPDADRVREALARAELVVVSDCERETDTTALAHVLLPAAAWGEKDGTVTNSERCVSRQRPFATPPGEARPDWWIVTEVASRMGFGDAFAYRSPAEIFREHAALTAFENGGTRTLDLGAAAGLTAAGYAAWQPRPWPLESTASAGTARLFCDGRFATPSGRARLLPVTPRQPAHAPGDGFPLVLLTGRLRDQWHTMTRTGRAPRLGTHAPEPTVAVNPRDALAHGVCDGGLARVWSRWGEVVVRVRLSAAQAPGTLFVPMHWSGPFASRARVGAVVNPATDPVSGEPEFKHTPVRLAPFAAAWHAFLLAREPARPDGTAYWVRSRGDGLWRHELAGERPIADLPALARRWLGDGGEWLELSDPAGGRYRGARIDGGRLTGCLLVAPGGELPARTWLASLFAAGRLDDRQRLSLLSGHPPPGQPDGGETVCACFNVGRETLLAGIREHGLASAAEVGALLQAGTNCGSCIPELKALLASAARQAAA